MQIGLKNKDYNKVKNHSKVKKQKTNIRKRKKMNFFKISGGKLYLLTYLTIIFLLYISLLFFLFDRNTIFINYIEFISKTTIILSISVYCFYQISKYIRILFKWYSSLIFFFILLITLNFSILTYYINLNITIVIFTIGIAVDIVAILLYIYNLQVKFQKFYFMKYIIEIINIITIIVTKLIFYTIIMKLIVLNLLLL